MLRILPLIILTFVLSFALATTVRAATLSVKTIGGMSVGTVVPTSWTHSGANPIITGSASPSATVQISIEDVPYTTAANALGDWSFTPTTITTNGAYEMVVSSGIENLIFTLNITGVGVGGGASTASATASTSSGQPTLPTALPSTGSPAVISAVVLGLLSLGAGAIAYAKLPGYLEEEL